MTAKQPKIMKKISTQHLQRQQEIIVKDWTLAAIYDKVAENYMVSTFSPYSNPPMNKSCSQHTGPQTYQQQAQRFSVLPTSSYDLLQLFCYCNMWSFKLSKVTSSREKSPDRRRSWKRGRCKEEKCVPAVRETIQTQRNSLYGNPLRRPFLRL